MKSLFILVISTAVFSFCDNVCYCRNIKSIDLIVPAIQIQNTLTYPSTNTLAFKHTVNCSVVMHACDFSNQGVAFKITYFLSTAYRIDADFLLSDLFVWPGLFHVGHAQHSAPTKFDFRSAEFFMNESHACKCHKTKVLSELLT